MPNDHNKDLQMKGKALVCCVYDTSGYRRNYKARESGVCDECVRACVNIAMQGYATRVYLELQRR